MVNIGDKNKKERYRFFNSTHPKTIEKERPKELNLSGMTVNEIVKIIDGLSTDEHLKISQDLIPEDWRDLALNKKRKPDNQNEIVNHGPWYLMEFARGVPSEVIKHEFGKIGRPYALYAWEGEEKKFWRIYDIFEGDRIYTEGELIGEPVETKGSKKEFCAEVLSRSLRDNKSYEIVMRNVPAKEDLKRENFEKIKNIKTSDHCNYNKHYYFNHYREGFCSHDIAALYSLKDENIIPFDYFPRPNEHGRHFYKNLMDGVIKLEGNRKRNLTSTEEDILLQNKIIKDGPGNVFS